MQITKFRFIGLLNIIILLFLGTGICLCDAQEADKQGSALGELKLEGKYIDRLVLWRKDGRTERFNRPEETIKLPAGEYRLQEVRLEGGYTCRLLSVSGRDWVTVDEDKPAVLKVGAPLKQTVKAQRRGRILALNYELLGVGGEMYTSANRTKPPTFTVYKGDKEIASDKFEFGWGGTCSYSWRVPPTAFGELKIIASQDIGELGPKEGTAVLYNWKWYYSIPALALWVVLLGAIVLVKANRNPRALLIVLPLLVANLLWLGFVRLLNFPSVARVQYDPLFVSYTVGIAVLWLLAHKLGNRNRFVTFLLALIIMIVVGFVGLTSYSMGKFSNETTLFLAFLAVLALAVLVGFVLAARLCQKHFNALRFMLWLALWTVINSVAAMLTFMVIMFLVQSRPNNMIPILLQILIFGLVAGLLLYVINLPFMILALSSPFFRERFYACLRLKSMPTAIVQADADQPGEQNPNPETSENSGSV